MTHEEVVAIVEGAVFRLASEQLDLLTLGVNEQTISHQLAGYIRKSIPDGLRVDVEYDRHGEGAKFLHLPSKKGVNDERIASKVRPDVVVHRRGDDEQNILVIELKKPGLNLSRDRAKLEAFRDQYQYQNAAHVVLGRLKGKVVAQVMWVDG